MQSAIPGIPVPEGSVLDADGLFQDDQGVVMAFYTHPRWVGEQVLGFYDVQMPIWGWTAQGGGASHAFQRAYCLEGVQVLIGVDKRALGCRFSILKGVHGDWRYMAPLRDQG